MGLSTYIVNLSELQFVFFFIVKYEAVLVEEAHNWGFPAGTPQEINDDVEEPVLYKN